MRRGRGRIAAIHDRISTSSVENDSAVLSQMAYMVYVLSTKAMLDMVRNGRTGQLTAIMAAVVGEEKAVSQVEAILAVAREKGVLD